MDCLLEILFQSKSWALENFKKIAIIVADPKRFDSDPDPIFFILIQIPPIILILTKIPLFDSDPDPTYNFDSDQDPTYHYQDLPH